MIKKLPTLTSLIIYSIISLISIWRLLSFYGPIGYKHDWGYPQYGNMISNYASSMLYSWDEQSLGSELIYKSPCIYVLINGFFATLGVGGVFLTKFLVFSFVLGSAFFMFLLSKYYFKKQMPAFLSGLLYALNPLVFNRIVAGHVTYLFSYMLTPLLFLSFIKSKQDKRFFIFSALLFPLAISQLQFMIMLPALMLAYCLFMKDKRLFYCAIFSFLIGFIVHSSWLTPLIIDLSRTTLIVSSSATNDFIIKQSPPIYAAVFLLGFTHFLRAVNLVPFLIGGVIILILLLINLKSKQKFVWFFILLAVIGLFLSKGASAPFGELFLSLPFVQLFREVNHLMFLPAFAYSILIGSSYELIKNKNLFPLFILAIILFSYPMLSGDFMGQAQTYEWGNYGELLQSINDEPDYFRVLYLPMNQPIKPINLTHAGIDPMISSSIKPSFNQMITIGTDSDRITA